MLLFLNLRVFLNKKNTICYIHATIHNTFWFSTQATTIISKASDHSSHRSISRTLSPSQLQEQVTNHGTEVKQNGDSGNSSKSSMQENKSKIFHNSTSSESSSPPTTKTRKTEPKQQLYHELTQQTLRLEKPKVV